MLYQLNVGEFYSMRKEIVILVGITLLAGLLRFYKLDSYPTLTVDAAAVGYNAYSIIKTGKDEFGTKFPVFFKSFGEGKLPLYVYEAVIPVLIFGLNIFAARFATAFLATLTILVTYFLVRETLKLHNVKDKNLTFWAPLAASFFLATMPWHIQFSREIFGQESLFWIALGSYLTLKFLNESKIKFWIFGLLSFSAGLMTYHAAKSFVPLWIIYILGITWKKAGFRKTFVLGLTALVLSGSVWLWMSSSELGKARAKDVSVFSNNSDVKDNLWKAQIIPQNQPAPYTRFLYNKLSAYSSDIANRYFSHFNPSFLFFEGNTERERTSTPYTGLMLKISLPIVVFGSYLLTKKKVWSVLIFLAIAPIASSLTYGEVNSVRSVYMTVPLAIICGIGLIGFITVLLTQRTYLFINKLVIIVLGILFIHNFLQYLNSYYVHQEYFHAKDWQYETREIVEEITKTKDKYEKVVVTTNMGGNPYIYFLFYNQYDPAKWHKQANNHIEKDIGTSFIHIGRIDNIVFSRLPCVTRSEDIENNTLYLCKANTYPDGLKIIKRFYWPDQTESFILGVKK
jgi:4-amino-4-deoxy-L-arabinose transferase-like glycosyltransferase